MSEKNIEPCERSFSPGPPLRSHHGAAGFLGVSKGELLPTMPNLPPIDISISGKDGVVVGGHCLAGCTHWEIVRDYTDGTTEVRLVLLTNKLTVDLSAPGEHPNRVL